MEHRQASPLVSDWVRGALDGERAAAVERHVRQCPECSEAAEAARALMKELARVRRAATAHPSSDELARYVAAPETEPTAALATVAVHLSGCDPCRDDVTLLREAMGPGWLRAARAWLASAPALPRPLQPAMAALLVVLIVPSWIGIVEAPRRVRTAEEATALAQAEAAAARDAAVPRGGGVAALVLRGATRSSEEAPALQLRPGQVLQPLLLDVNPPAGPLAARVVDGPGDVVWSAEGPREDFWDETNQLLGLLVPVAALPPGVYRVEVAAGPAGETVFAAGFRIR
jgi:hypothetical protein